MKIAKHESLKGGHTNETFKVKSAKQTLFYKKFKFDQFNHKLDYTLLKRFSFVPKQIKIAKDQLYSEFITGTYPAMNDANLTQIAGILRTLHQSKLPFPTANLLDRVNTYYKMIQAKPNVPAEVKANYHFVKKIIAGFNQATPLHNDPWINNFLVDQQQKIYLIDWEYASMGDKHFDLAYFIDGSFLTDVQMTHFLEVYDDFDWQKIYEAKFVVNYLTMLWLHRFDELPFPDTRSIQRIHSLKAKLANDFNLHDHGVKQ